MLWRRPRDSIYFHAKARSLLYFEIISERYGNHILDGTNKIILAKSPDRDKLIFFQFHKATNAHWQKILERQLGKIENFSMFANNKTLTILHDVFVLSGLPCSILMVNITRQILVFQNFQMRKKVIAAVDTLKKITGDAKIICLMVRDDQYLRIVSIFAIIQPNIIVIEIRISLAMSVR